MQVTITAINRTPRVSKKTGANFVSLGIKTDQHGEKWLSGFGNTENAEWDIGSTVNIEVEQKGDFLNFKAAAAPRDSGPAANDPAAAELKNILTLKVIPLLVQIDLNIKELIKNQPVGPF